MGVVNATEWTRFDGMDNGNNKDGVGCRVAPPTGFTNDGDGYNPIIAVYCRLPQMPASIARGLEEPPLPENLQPAQKKKAVGEREVDKKQAKAMQHQLSAKQERGMHSSGAFALGGARGVAGGSSLGGVAGGSSSGAGGNSGAGGQQIKVEPNVYIRDGQAGDFVWELRAHLRPSGLSGDPNRGSVSTLPPFGSRTLWIFNDNEEDRLSARPGSGNAKIRAYNQFSAGSTPGEVLATGVTTGSLNRGGFKCLNAATRKIIDEDLHRLDVLLKTGAYC